MCTIGMAIIIGGILFWLNFRWNMVKCICCGRYMSNDKMMYYGIKVTYCKECRIKSRWTDEENMCCVVGLDDDKKEND